MADDVFCKIIRGELPRNELYSDERVVVIHDVHPQAPVHLVVFPLTHIESVGEVPQSETELLGHMIRVGHIAAEKAGLTNGYRMILNDGVDSEKAVPHLHLHVIGGKPLGSKLVE